MCGEDVVAIAHAQCPAREAGRRWWYGSRACAMKSPRPHCDRGPKVRDRPRGIFCPQADLLTFRHDAAR